jgi:hypothetical protein
MNLHTRFGVASSVLALSVATLSSVAVTSARQASQESSSRATVLWQFEAGG